MILTKFEQIPWEHYQIVLGLSFGGYKYSEKHASEIIGSYLKMMQFYLTVVNSI